MVHPQIALSHLKVLILGVFYFCSIALQAQNADLSLVQVTLPDTVVLDEVASLSAYLKNNTDTEYSVDNLQLNFYVNELQDVEKSAVIQSVNIADPISIPAGDSILIEQNLLIDNLLFQIGEQQDIQKNIIIVWPTEDNYSIDYHLQPIVVFKQAIPTVVYNAMIPLSETMIPSTNLPVIIQDFIFAEYADYTVNEVTQQGFDDNSIQFEVKLKNAEENEISLYFGEEGTLVLTETELDESALPLTIQNFIATNHPSNTIESVYLLTFSDGTIQYIVELENDDIELYFDEDGNDIAEIGIVVELYEEPDIEIGGIDFSDVLELGTDAEINGTLTNNLDVPYNDIVIPINYAAITFPPTVETPRLRTQDSNIDVLGAGETKTFNQTVNVNEDLFYLGKNIVFVWATDNIMNLTSNCINQEVTVTREGGTVGFETIMGLSNEVHIAPNPTANLLNIQTKSLQIESITVYDLASKLIEEYSSIHQNSFRTDLSHLNDGLYLLYIQTDKGNTVKKLVLGH